MKIHNIKKYYKNLLFCLLVILLTANAVFAERKHLRTTSLDFSNQTISLYGGTKNTLEIVNLPYGTDKIQFSKASSKTDSKVLGRSNKDIEPGSNDGASFNIFIEDGAESEVFHLKTFTKSFFGYQILEKADITIEVINCTKEHKPVCAIPPSNCDEDSLNCNEAERTAVTYNNLCEAHKANAELVYKGSCQ